jgi:hypothetical protein
MFEFATSESVSDTDYIGCGNSSNNFLRNTLVVPRNCTAVRLTFSIRTFNDPTPYTIHLYVNGIDSGVTAVIADGSIATAASAVINYPLNEFDLLSLKFSNGSNAALQWGICAMIIAQIN